LAAPKLLLDQPVTGLPPADELLLQIMFIAFNVAGALLFALLIVYLIGGAVLPVRTAAEQWECSSSQAICAAAGRHCCG
jgi:hypothetical protein